MHSCQALQHRDLPSAVAASDSAASQLSAKAAMDMPSILQKQAAHVSFLVEAHKQCRVLKWPLKCLSCHTQIPQLLQFGRAGTCKISADELFHSRARSNLPAVQELKEVGCC